METEVYLEPSETSRIELFSSIADIRKGSKYASDSIHPS